MNLAEIESDTVTDAMAWQLLHQPHIDAWIETQPPIFTDDGFDIRSSAANGLFSYSMLREEEGHPEPYSWAGVDPYEVLFDALIHGGTIHDDWAEYLQLVGSLACFLCTHNVIPPAERAVFEEEWDLWMERLLDVSETHCWYERDGTRLTAEQLIERSKRFQNAEKRRRESRRTVPKPKVKKKRKKAFGRMKR